MTNITSMSKYLVTLAIWAGISFMFSIVKADDIESDIKLVSTHMVPMVEYLDVGQGNIQKAMDDNYYYLSVKLSPEHGKNMANITKNNIGRSMALILNGYWIGAPKILDEISGHEMVMILDEDFMTSPHAKFTKPWQFTYFIIEDEYQLPNDTALTQIKPNVFSVSLDDEIKHKLCKASHILLFKDNVLTAKKRNCNEKGISFERINHHVQ